MTVALCQCIRCERYLARNRAADGTDPQLCVHCTEIENRGMFDDLKIPPGIPLARIRGTLQDPIAIEVLALLVEECGEVAQRVGKINRWGWEADFEGTTQRHKLEVELGDVVANMVLAHKHGFVSLYEVVRHAEAKMDKYRVDAAGPRQRLLHATPPSESVGEFLVSASETDH